MPLSHSPAAGWLFQQPPKRIVPSSLFVNQVYESAEAQQILKAFASIGRIGPDLVMLILRI